MGDAKKGKSDDQVGFYSDNIDPATAEAYARSGGGAGGFPPGGFPGGGDGEASGQGAHFDFGGFDFSDMFENAGRSGRASSTGSGSFKDIFSGIFGGGRGRAATQTRPEAVTDPEDHVHGPCWTTIPALGH